MKKNVLRQFTLIEIIITLSILAILAVNLAPKYRDVTREATLASLRGVVAKLNSRESSLWAKVKIGGHYNSQGQRDAQGRSSDESIFNHVTTLSDTPAEGAGAKSMVFWDSDGIRSSSKGLATLKGNYEIYGGTRTKTTTVYLMVVGHEDVALAVQRRSGSTDQPGYWQVVSEDNIADSVRGWIDMESGAAVETTPVNNFTGRK